MLHLIIDTLSIVSLSDGALALKSSKFEVGYSKKKTSCRKKNTIIYIIKTKEPQKMSTVSLHFQWRVFVYDKLTTLPVKLMNLNQKTLYRAVMRHYM
jgi:hypothetical protein